MAEQQKKIEKTVSCENSGQQDDMIAINESNHTQLLHKKEMENNLKDVIAKVRQNFKWYDELVRKTIYDRLLSVFNLPYIDEPLLDKFYYNVRNDNAVYDYVYYTSGTTTGIKKRILYSKREHSLYLDHRRMIFSKFITSDCKKACSDLGTGHAADSAVTIFQNLGLETVKINPSQPIEEHIKILNHYKPDIFFTMPMILDKIVNTKQLCFSPKKIIVVGDVATERWKKHISEYFCIKRDSIMDILGSIEVGSIAYECYKCGLYHFEDHIIPESVETEFLYPDYHPDFSANILVLTSSARDMFPALRFITNDLIEGLCICKCNGNMIFSFNKILGRVGNEFKHGEKISLYDITEAINSYLPGSLFNIYNGEDCIIKLHSPNFTPEAGDNIVNHLKKLNPDIDEMIQSSILGDIKVIPTSLDELKNNKRIFIKDRT